MVSQPVPLLTAEEYLAWERAAETKSEYVDGTRMAMSGASPRHVLVTANIVGEIHQQLKGRPCLVYGQNLRVRIAEAGMYAYPDVVVVCGEPEFEEGALDTLLNPTLIVDVLSESTEAYDRGLKAIRYRQRASLQGYLLVAQDRPNVEFYARDGDHWRLTEAAGPDAAIDLPSIGCTLALRDVYDKVVGLANG